jgi:hypothetical protein
LPARPKQEIYLAKINKPCLYYRRNNCLKFACFVNKHCKLTAFVSVVHYFPLLHFTVSDRLLSIEFFYNEVADVYI